MMKIDYIWLIWSIPKPGSSNSFGFIKYNLRNTFYLDILLYSNFSSQKIKNWSNFVKWGRYLYNLDSRPNNLFFHAIQMGKHRAFEEGEWFKKRYTRLFATVNSHTNITMLSSHLDRTIMTGECFLAGFFNPRSDQILIKNLKWQPVSIHSNSLSKDNVSILTSLYINIQVYSLFHYVQVVQIGMSRCPHDY